jgi:nitrogen fixation/metabolism regulation signal transduction histidine kinase
METLSDLALAGACGLAAGFLRRRAAYPWRTMSSMIESVRLGDYSVRARVRGQGDSVSDALAELNSLGDALRDRRLETLEVNELLSTVLEAIDVAIFAFNDRGKLRLVNHTGARLLGAPSANLIDSGAEELGLAEFLNSRTNSVIEHSFPGASGRWTVRHTTFRESGRPHELLVISDLTRELREEELLAWQRLVRVLGHELNNSLTPIQSIARSLDALLRGDSLADDWREDMLQGLAVIASRSDSLARFVSSYARLARLPAPDRQQVAIGLLSGRVALIFPPERVEVVPGPPVTVDVDPDQIEQALINLIQNGVDAAATTGGMVRLTWEVERNMLELRVEDEGTGLANPANAFVPFFTTRPGGSGIGLVLCRKIAEGHGGSITLENRQDGPGCVATLRLPL